MSNRKVVKIVSVCGTALLGLSLFLANNDNVHFFNFKNGEISVVKAASNQSTHTTYPKTYTSADLKTISDKEVNQKVAALLRAMTFKEKYSFLVGHGMSFNNAAAGYHPGIPRLGIPETKMYDGPDGVFFTEDTTNAPIEEMVAATWSPNIAYQYGKFEGRELRAIGGNYQLAPQVDIMRSPWFTRSEDELGADPYLLRRMAGPAIKGDQSEHVISTIKHYAGYAEDRYGNNVKMSEQALHEIYLSGFESAVKNGKALGLMTSYNAINGEFTPSSSLLQNDILRKMWGFKGVTMTDWGGNHEYSLNKGTDIEEPAESFNSMKETEKLIKEGKMSEKDIDIATGHVLFAMGKAGYLNDVQLDKNGNVKEEAGRSTSDPIKLETDESALVAAKKQDNVLARKIAEQGAVLLKNKNGVLPLQKSKSVALIGPSAMQALKSGGGERSWGTLSAYKSPYSELKAIMGNKVHGYIGENRVGNTIQNKDLYTSATGNEHGVVRTYGIRKDLQNGDRGAKDILMPNHQLGEKTDKIDANIDFTTGKINGKANTTWLSKNADAKTANAFPADTKAAYTWTTYIEAPETGTYSLMLNGIGGAVWAQAESEDGVKNFTVGGMRSGAQWPNGASGNGHGGGSWLTTPTGMDIIDQQVKLVKGKRYKVTVAGNARFAQKDLQVRLSWVTPSQKRADYNQALKAAAKNSTSVVFAYRGNPNEGKSIKDSNLALDEDQTKLIKDVAKVAKKHHHKVAVVLYNGTPVTLNNWLGKVDGLLEMFYPGQAGGAAVSNLLTGKVNPSGKLSFTWPKEKTDTVVTHSENAWKENNIPGTSSSSTSGGLSWGSAAQAGAYGSSNYSEGIMTDYRWFDQNHIKPQFAFGYGLSYSKFKFGKPTIKKSHDGYDITLTVKNVSKRKGNEVVQVYLGKAKLPKGLQSANKQLAGFVKINDLKPGASKKVKIHLDKRTLSYWNSNIKDPSHTVDKWRVAKGKRAVYIGTSEQDTVYKRSINVK
ncbi:glycoside hydrolase family 3 C-terminal domain-containing protein [Lactiplantibacillus plantarum]